MPTPITQVKVDKNGRFAVCMYRTKCELGKPELDEVCGAKKRKHWNDEERCYCYDSYCEFHKALLASMPEEEC